MPKMKLVLKMAQMSLTRAWSKDKLILASCEICEYEDTKNKG